MLCRRLFCVTLLLLVSLVLPGYTESRAPSEQLDLSKGVELYRQNRLDEALPVLERAAKRESRNPDALAYLAETLRRLGQQDEAVKAGRRATAIDPCHSFAHTVLADAYNPLLSSWEGANAETTWQHLHRATECDPTDGNAWTGIWVQAMRRGNRGLERKALRSFIETRFLAPPVLSYNSWVLRNLPENALLLTNGDMDTYPALALQEVQELRPDVDVVNLSLLNVRWYARIVRDRYKIPMGFSDRELSSLGYSKDKDGKLVTVSKKIVKAWIDLQKTGKFPRPLTMAITVADLDFTPDTRSRLQMAGPYWLCLPESTDTPEDTSKMRISLADINPVEFSGSFVSPIDRSPVRITRTDRIVTNVTALALRYANALLESGQASEAHRWATWAEEFERNTKAGPVLTKQIKELKKAAKQKM